MSKCPKTDTETVLQQKDGQLLCRECQKEMGRQSETAKSNFRYHIGK